MDLERKQNLINLIRGVIRGRWVIIVGAAALGMVQQAIGASSVSLSYGRVFGLVAIGSFFNLFYSWYLRKGLERSDAGVQMIAALQIIVDQIIYTVVVYTSGGIESLSFLFYVLPILIATVLFGTSGILISAFLNVFLYVAVVVLEYTGTIQHLPRYYFEPGIYGNLPVTFSNTLLVVTVIFLSAIFATFISQLLRSRQEELIKERDTTKAVIASFADGLILINEKGVVDFVNPRAQFFLNVNLRWIQGKKMGEFRGTRFEILRRILEAENRKDGSVPRIFLKGKQETVLEVLTAPIVNLDGETTGSMKILRDITHDVIVERLKTEFVSITSHQLRTPLAATKWAIAYLMHRDAGPITKEQLEILTMAYESNERMILLINDLLDVTRIEEGRFIFKFERVILSDLVDRIVKEVKPEMVKRKIRLVWKKPASFPVCSLDVAKIMVAVENLLDNAMKYTPESKTVTVSLKHDTMNAVLKIEDQGIGISKAEQKKLFSKFFRGTNALRLSTEGSGLGLFIVKSIIEGHRGIIEIVSEEGRGTVVTIRLPYLGSP